MAFFPTQKDSWNKYQKIKGHENDCGRPGINGGYMANPNIKFGVNCYGVKPKPNESQKNRMINDSKFPIIGNVTSPKDQALNNKIEFYKKNKDKILVVNAFNSKQQLWDDPGICYNKL
jgi:hypothetical protein